MSNPDPPRAPVEASLSPLKRAFLALEAAEARVAELERAAREPIAIIGMGCRVPGADNPEELWRVLERSGDMVGPPPAERWDGEAFFDPNPETPGKIASKRAGFLRVPVDGFDAGLFGISPREAQGMDPQQRLLLEVCWEALENAGKAPNRLERSATGVYLGMMSSDYANMALKTGDLHLLDAHFTLGVAHSVASGRISYLLGLQGPALTVDTACSSSLVALHLACQALRSGDCSMALAGGVNMLLAPELTIALSRARMLAPDGRCKTFDAAADGFARGEGCGIVVLKRLRDAEADGDRVLAVVRGSAVNQDGPSGSLTAPNGPAQEAVIREALVRAGLEPHDVGYIEAHGTGTELGDPLEVQALGAVFAEGRDPATPMWLASVKTNLGHLEGAAGVVGLIKLVLCMRHGQIPESLHFRNPSPHIPWSELPFRVPTMLQPWEPIRGRRVGGVSSFGFSGTNAHVVVEEAPSPEPLASAGRDERVAHLFVLSARSEAALRASAARHAAALAANPSLHLADVCLTAGVGRARLPVRAGIVTATTAELAARLKALAEQGEVAEICGPARAPRDPPRVAFLFTGQGAQYAGMARGLYEREPVFRESLDRVAALLARRLDRPLLGVLFTAEGEASPIDETGWTQPALFAVQIALIDLLRSWGVRPDMVIGHSVGEFAAACAAGVMSVEDAAMLVAERGCLMQSLPAGGAMAAVFAPEARVAPALDAHRGQVAIAAVNAPEQTVISGTAAAVEAVCAALGAEGIRCKRLTVSHAFHSPLVDPILDAFERAAARVSFSPPRLPLVSNLTGRVVEADAITRPGYWRQHVRQAVRFGDGLKALGELRPGVVVEIGPQATLLPFAKAVYQGSGPALVPTLARHQADGEAILRAVASLYLSGVDVDFRAVGAASPGARRIVDLPTYPFERERFWFHARSAAAPGAQGRPTGHPLLGVRLRTAGSEVIFEAPIGADSPGFVRDHRVQGRVILPGTAYLEAMLSAGARALGSDAVAVTDMTLGEAMILDDDGSTRRVQIVCAPQGGGATAVSFLSAADAGEGEEVWLRHASAVVKAAEAAPAPGPSLEAIRQQCPTVITSDEHYADYARRGLPFGPSFHVVQSVRRGAGHAVGEVELPEALARDAATYRIHPVLLDGCFQTIAAALSDEPEDTLYLPIGVGTFVVYGPPGTRCMSHVALRPGGTEVKRADVRVLDANANLVAELRDLQFKRISRDALARLGERRLDDCLFEVVWREASLPSPSETPPRAWLVVADRSGLGRALTAKLAADGDRCVLVHLGTSYALEQGTATIDPSSNADPARLLEELRAAGFVPDGVVHLGSIGGAPWENASAGDVATSKTHGITSALHLTKALVDAPSRPRLWILTSGAHAVGPSERAVDPLQAAVWGLGRTLRHEHRDLHCVCVDVHPAAPSAVDGLVGELRASATEPEVALRSGARRVPRLTRMGRARANQATRGEAPFQLAPAARGSFDAFVRAPLARRAPGPDEVEIAVEATGLNFRDVLNVLGMYPGDAGAIGGECAGTVLAVGAGVEHVRPGDAVLAVTVGSFASHVVARGELVRRRPDGMTAEEGAAFPIAYVTAAVCLDQAANLRAGERVLIHAASGGVGLAAVRVAQRTGAVVVATAGSPWKRNLLRSIGVKYVFDSRSTSFADEIAATLGEVDVVLNSLSGDLIDASFRVLKPGGRFVEIGKRGIKEPREVEALGLGHAYHVVDWSETSTREPAVIGRLLEQLVDELREGKLVPLPRQVFSLDEASQAFRFMAQARHVGRIVVRHGPPSLAIARKDGTYLVTGGLSGLGLATAAWLVERGAGRVVLAGRRRAVESNADITALKARATTLGAEVVTEALDVSDEAAVQALLARLRTAGPPIRGIVHGAGVLEDAAFSRQDASGFSRVFAPKVDGARLLDSHTRADALDFFVMFSSLASVVGSPGQANYASANAFLDALAIERHGRGLPGLSLDWGAWSQVGMAADQGIVERLGAQGIGALTPAEGCLVIERTLAEGAAQVVVLAADWPRYVARSTDPTAGALVAELLGAEASRSAAREPGPTAKRPELFREKLAVEPRGRWRAVVGAFVRDHALGALGLEASRPVDPQVPLRQIGLDSLLAVELRNRLSAALSKPLPSSLLFDAPTLEALTEHVLGLVLEAEGDQRPAQGHAQAPAAAPSNLVGAIEELSDEEVERQLAAMAVPAEPPR
jgi:acyl transferase domain-containing protein